MPHDEHILPGAFGEEPKTVPLVVYEKDGTRRVVGSATVSQDKDGLHLTGHITDPDTQKLVETIIKPKFEE